MPLKMDRYHLGTFAVIPRNGLMKLSYLLRIWVLKTGKLGRIKAFT